MLSILFYGSFLISSIYANDYAAPDPPVDNSYVSEPVDNSYVSEPVDNSYVSEPVDNSYASEPVDNSYAPPADNSYVSEPVDNSYASEPVDNSYASEPVDNSYASEPVDNSYATPVDNSYVSEPQDNSYGSEPVDNSYVSEPVDNSYAPPADNSYAPPEDNSYASEPVDDSYTTPQDSYSTPQDSYTTPQDSYTTPQDDAYTAPVDAYTAPQPDYSSPPPSPVIYVPTAKSWADAQAYCASQNSNLLTITGDNVNAMVACAEYLSPTGLVWTGLNRLGPDGYGTSTYEFVSGVDFPGAAAYGEGPFALGDGYSDGNCAYMNKGLQTSNMGFQCDELFPFCCDPVTEAYPSSMTNGYDSNVPDTGYSGGGSTGSGTGTGTPIGGSDYTGPSPDNNVDPSCPRVRKEWNTATQEERQLYIDAILQLSADGTLQKFVEQHSNMISDRQAHGTSAFLPWHRGFLFELEAQIRALGGRFACTALLYWNWARDVELYGHKYSDYSILNSGLGGSGDPQDNYCVSDGAFTKSAYTPYKCDDTRWMSTQDGKCCLRRNTAINYQSSGMLGLRGMLNAIISDSYYGIDKDNNLDGIRDNLEKGPHDISHCTIGGCRRTQYADSRGHLGSSSSPDDPIFWLLHGFVDYAWALWQDFYEYEIMHKDYLTQAAYNGQAVGSTGGSISRIDDKLSFVILNQQTPGFLKYITGDLAIRDVHSITEMGYQYHMGSFIPDSKIYTCGLNSDWFVGVMPDCSGGSYSGGSGSGSTGSGSSYTAPATDSYTAPATDTYTQPATDSYTQPATDTYAQPATDTYSQPATDTYAQPDTNDGYGLPPAPDSNYVAPAEDTYGATPAEDTYGQTPVDTGYATAFDPGYSAPVDTGYGEVSINGGYTDGAAIDNSLYEIISASYGDRQYTIEGKQEMTATLAKMECEIQMSGYSGCTRPQFFYNCCDLPRTGNSYGNYPDIDVTLEQLLEWAPTDCMKETRYEMFGWAMEFGSLYRLCRGDYDTFCDGDFLQGSYGDTCVTLDQYTSSYGGDSNTGSYSSPVDSSYGAPADSSYGAPADSSYAAPADSSYAPPVDQSYSAVSGGVSIDQQPISGGNDSGKFNQLEAMVLNGVINGIIFSIIIVLFMTIYVCYRRYYNGPYTKVKFANDVEN